MSEQRVGDIRQSKPVAAPVKQVRLKLVYVDLWSAVKVSAATAAFVAASGLVLTITLWAILRVTGILGAIEAVLIDILGEGSGGIVALLQFSQVIALALVSAVINLVSITVLGSLGSLVYNLIARLTGGLMVGFQSN